MARAATRDDLFNKKPRTQDYDLVLDEAVAKRVNTLRSRDSDLSLLIAPTADQEAEHVRVLQELEELEPRLDDATVTLTFVALPAAEYDTLQAKYPPTDEQAGQLAAVGKIGLFDPVEFEPALIAASLPDLKLEAADVKELFASGNWSAGEKDAMFGLAFELNRRTATVDWGNAFAGTRSSQRS